jgi:hypothetical protein
MPDPNTFDPVAEFQKAYPAANLDENRIRASLQDPANFRAAFPAYSHLNDATITTNMKQFAPGGAAQKATAAARVAQPTQFEEESKARGDSATPWTDVAKGVGEGLLRPVSGVAGLINKIPHVGETLAPSQGVKALQNVSTPVTPGEKLGAHEADVATTLIPIAGEAGEARAAGKLLPYAKKLATGAIGSMVGGEAGKYVGGHVGGELGADIGEGLGALGGGLAGGGAFGEKYRKIGNPSELPYFGKFLPDLVEDKGFVPMGPTRVNDSHIAELNKPPVPAVAETPFHLTSPAAAREEPVQTGFSFPEPVGATEAPAGIPTVGKPAPGRTGPPLQRLGDLIEAGAGTPPGGIPTLKPGVPIGKQPAPYGGNYGGKVTFRRDPMMAEIPSLEEGAGRAKAPENLPTLPPEEVGRQMGAPPTQYDKPFREQLKPTGNEPPSKQAALEEKYPDRVERRLVHINGENMHEAAKGDPETYDAVTKLSNSDIRQAAINSGIKMVREDGSPIMVNDRKASGDISRREIFDRLLAAGRTPKAILEMARAEEGEPVGAGKPGPMRSQPWGSEREKTGD